MQDAKDKPRQNVRKTRKENPPCGVNAYAIAVKRERM
jgi:hypothetical protein